MRYTATWLAESAVNEERSQPAHEITPARPPGDPFDVVVDLPPGDDPAPWARAGATWSVTDVGSHPGLARVRGVIEAGPAGA